MGIAKNINYQVVVTSDSNGQTKELKVVAKVKTYRRSGAGKKVTEASEIIYRNSLVFALYPNINWSVLQIPGTSKDPAILNPFVVDGHEFKLDLASNSRLARDFVGADGQVSWGSFTYGSSPLFTRGIGHHYMGTARADRWKRIIYGSILHTGCKRLVALDLDYIVVDDEQIPDDPTNGIMWNSGDSHAKSSALLFQLLGLETEYLVDTPVEDWKAADTGIALQFRVAKPAKYKPGFTEGFIGKGTFEYSQTLQESDHDFVLPLSSMKGNKLPLGNYSDRMIVGYVFESEERLAKTGWMFFQHFLWETLESDGIVDRIINNGTELAQAYNSIIKLCQILRIDRDERHEYHENFSEQEEKQVQDYEDTFTMIVEADQQGKLFQHPYVLENLKERLRKRWLTMAKSGGIRFYSFMTMPDESLAHYNVWDDPVEKNFCVDGRVCCCPDLEEGEYIMFVNPLRSWGDIQIWENKHEGPFFTRSGVVAAPNKLFLTLGRDFDGDFVQMMHRDEYPAIAQAVEEFNAPPRVNKLPKEQISGTLQEIAVGSMSNVTGLVAALQGITIANNMSYAPFVVPVGGIYKEEQEMTIIEFLAQELQIAVDSLKSATPNNMAGIEKLQQYFKEQNMAIPWQAGFKDPDVYRNKVCPVDANHDDTLSRMVRLVNSLWKEAEIPASNPPTAFKDVLFKNITSDARQDAIATSVRDQYRNLMTEAIRYRKNTESSTRIQEVLEFFTEERERILRLTNPETGNHWPHESWVASFWRVCHKANSGRAGLVFFLFKEDIIDALKNLTVTYYRIHIIGMQYMEGVDDFSPYHGSVISAQFFYETIMTAKPKQWLEVEKEKIIVDENGEDKIIIVKELVWDRPRDSLGNIIKEPRLRTYCRAMYGGNSDWQTIGIVSDRTLHSCPEIPLDGQPSETLSLRAFVIKNYGEENDTSQVVLLPDNVRDELGQAEVETFVRSVSRTLSSFFWYLYWLHDSGFGEADIRQIAPDIESDRFKRWIARTGKKMPWE